MADVKISQLPAATTPVDGTEVLPIVQSATTKQVSIANLTAGRPMSASSLTLTTPLAVTSGGTGLAAGTSGGIPYYSSTTAITSSAALAANALVIGGGAGVAPSTTTTASGILTFLGTPSSANLAAAVTDETGTGSLVFGTSPTFTTSAIFPAGTVSAPGITTTGDTNTGVYFPAADTVAITTAGSEDMRFTPEGNVTLNSATFSPTTPGTAGNMAMTGTLAMGSSFLRNRIINGDMRIDQRNAGSAVTAASSFPVDRFLIPFSTDGAFSAQQDTVAPAGFVNSLKFTTTTADSSLSAAQFALIRQNIEGLNVSDLGWGSASALTITVSFWVRSTLTGTFSAALLNNNADRSYILTYTISVADTWEYKTATIPGDTTGTWLTTNGVGIRLEFSMGVGSDFQGTAGSWTATNDRATAGSVSVIGTLNATWAVTGVQLEVGSVATPFERRQYGTELMLCQRYYQRIQGDTTAQRMVGVGVVGSATQIFRILTPVKTSMRANPDLDASGLTGYDGTSNTAVTVATNYSIPTQISFDVSGGSGFTTGRSGIILTGGSATSFFAASAEL